MWIHHNGLTAEVRIIRRHATEPGMVLVETAVGESWEWEKNIYPHLPEVERPSKEKKTDW